MPGMAIRTLRLGEETNQLPALAAQVADYFEARLDRNIERIVGGHDELDRHVAACNRRAAALTVAVELARVHL